MGKGEIRDVQLASIIAEELEYVLGSANDSRLADLTVRQVLPGIGGKHFTVCLAYADGCQEDYSTSEIQDVLNRAAGYLRSEVASSLNLKRAPEMTFMLDPLQGLEDWS